MNLSTQLKELRKRDGLSQEALAERIYVTRQTVSNWETGKSYPDIQSLLMLSVLFDVSLDELVKGDIEMMKNELDVYKMKVWSWFTLIPVVIAGVSVVPLFMAFDFPGLIIPAALYALAIVAATVIERIKKKHCIQAYSEIVAFVEGKPVDTEKVPWGRRHKNLATAVKVASGAAVGFLLALVGWLIWALMAL